MLAGQRMSVKHEREVGHPLISALPQIPPSAFLCRTIALLRTIACQRRWERPSSLYVDCVKMTAKMGCSCDGYPFSPPLIQGLLVLPLYILNKRESRCSEQQGCVSFCNPCILWSMGRTGSFHQCLSSIFFPLGWCGHSSL